MVSVAQPRADDTQQRLTSQSEHCGFVVGLVRYVAMTPSYTRIFMAAGLVFTATATLSQVTPMTPDAIEKYEQTLPSADFIRRDAMVPIRDGVKLYTVVVMKKGTANGPILLSRSP